jgi:hypothetical protein
MAGGVFVAPIVPLHAVALLAAVRPAAGRAFLHPVAGLPLAGSDDAVHGREDYAQFAEWFVRTLG